MSQAVSSLGDPSRYKNITTALENLGIDKLVEFGKLAKTDLGKAGDNIVDGINSLSKISFDKNVVLFPMHKMEATFSKEEGSFQNKLSELLLFSRSFC